MLRPRQPHPVVNCHVLVDFDGTIASVDTTDAVLERFALPGWQDIEAEWQSGVIGSRECLARQVELIRATPAELDACSAGFEIDTAVPAFFDYMRRCGLEMSIVSDGLDRVVEGVLARFAIVATTRANRLDYIGAGRWRVSFPHAGPHAGRDCRARSGNCKCATPDADLAALRVVVGDGRSDFCVAAQADFVVAKANLAAYARLRNLPHATFTNFAEAKTELEQWLASKCADDRRAPPRRTCHSREVNHQAF